MKLTEEQKATALRSDADTVMEQIHMQESRHMEMSALVSHQLMYPDITIREFFAMASEELEEQAEELGYYE
tara:strand:+ start:479 stop:691 length:213 start_codon:yes stop_codon:yes gene_type:complete